MALIVVDLGCAPHGNRHSSKELIAAYKPDLLLGFDPLAKPRTGFLDGSFVIVSDSAASTFCGWIAFHEDGIESQTSFGEDAVRCFDLAALLRSLPGEVLLKMDVEGAEYPLLQHLINAGVWPDRILVEWHEQFYGTPEKERLLAAIPCEVEEWWM